MIMVMMTKITMIWIIETNHKNSINYDKKMIVILLAMMMMTTTMMMTMTMMKTMPT